MGGSARLIYSAIASVDGYVADEEGKFDWAEPDAEVHAFINDLERPIGTYREFDPEAVRRMKASARKDLTVGGPDLAGQVFWSICIMGAGSAAGLES